MRRAGSNQKHVVSPTLPPEFSNRLDDQERKIREIPFTVLVWGSGSLGEAAYEKRVRIRNHLADKFGDENVPFSEDEKLQYLVDEYGLQVAERLEIQAVDAVIILDTSIGPHTELIRYEDFLRENGIVFAPFAHTRSRGFASTAYDLVKVEGYTPEEFETCYHIRSRAKAFAQALRMKKYSTSIANQNA